MTYDLIVFDIAGTTVRDRDAVGDCLAAVVASRFDLKVTRDEVNSVMGLSKPAAIRALVGSRGVEASADEVDAAHADFVDRMVMFYRTDPAVEPMPAAAEVFSTLRQRGMKVALDTGFDRRITAEVLRRVGWEVGAMIDAVATSDEVPEGRPAPYMIFRLMQSLGVKDVRRVVKVGDTPSDLLEGTNAGCGRVIAATYGTHSAAELNRHPHTDLLPALTELPALLGS